VKSFIISFYSGKKTFMKVLFCSPEVTPFAKTGGLADVSAALPSELRNLGIDCLTAMPLYREISDMQLDLHPVEEISFLTANGIEQARIYSFGHILFVENKDYFSRGGMYSYAQQDYPDNLERFAFFSRACVELLFLIGDIDILHCNDWQTALSLAYLKSSSMPQIASVFTIHNLAYQGIFDASQWPSLFLEDSYFSPDYMEFYGRINIMKAGITLADMVNTVSPTYAKEIQTPQFGFGLDGLLRSISHKLTGIINGIDHAVWDPATDPHIAEKYNLHDMSGKTACKIDLQNRFLLEKEISVPLFGIISRLVEQKGIDLILDIIPEMVSMGCQLIILGSGNSRYEEQLRQMAKQYQGSLGITIGFDESLAHAIQAGADFFLMPSRFEPCGLNQMISMHYGTIPIVTPVGGLLDTVIALDEGPYPCGMRIRSSDSKNLLETIRQAFILYTAKDPLIVEMKKNAMKKLFHWSGPAALYNDLYRKLKAF